jgi:predicted RNA-binding Zn ribbon-like protein
MMIVTEMDHPPHGPAADQAIGFVNTAWTDHRGSGQRYDLLDNPARRARLLAGWGYRLDADAEANPAGLEVARRARAALRSVLEAWAGGGPIPRQPVAKLNALMRTVRVRPDLEIDSTPPRLRLEPARRDWAWLVAEVVAAAARLMASGEPARLKRCANPHCTWLFYDDSRNVSRRWCDAAACGDLVRVRAHRARRAARQGSDP